MSFLGKGEEKRKQIEFVLEHCTDNWQRLTEWEQGFVESVADQFNRRGTISEKQEDVLERIYVKLP